MSIDTINQEEKAKPGTLEADDRAPPGGKPPSSPAGKMPPSAIFLLIAICILGASLRFAGITWSLPDVAHPLATYQPDELINLNAAMQADIPHGRLDIGFYNYGAFYFYLVSFAHTIASGYHLITPASAVSPASQAAHQAELFLIGRVVSAILGTLTIPVVFALGNRLYERKTGLSAAFLYAVAPLAVVYAHFLAVDVTAVFFTALALLWSARILQNKPDTRDLILTGVWAGLAAATKYNAGLVILSPLYVLWGRKKEGGIGKQIGMLLGSTALSFFIGCPGPIINWNAFWNGIPGYPGSGIYYELFVHSRQGHGLLFVHTGTGWWYHLAISLPWGLGIPLFLLSGIGLASALIRRSQSDKFLLFFTLVYFGVIGFSAVRFARYTLPIYPGICLLASEAALGDYAHWKKLTPLIKLFFLYTSLVTLWISLSLDNIMMERTPQDNANIYLQLLPKGATIAFGTLPWFYSPPLSPYFGAPAPLVRERAAFNQSRFRLLLPSKDWDLSVLSPPPDAVVISNFETMHPLRLGLPGVHRFLHAIPADYIRKTFGVSTPFGLPDETTLIPDDMLYVMPKITVYINPQALKN